MKDSRMENAEGSSQQRNGEAVLNEVLVNNSALRQVASTGQAPAEVSKEQFCCNLTTTELVLKFLAVSLLPHP